MADSRENDLMRRIGRAGAEIDPGLTDRDVERLVDGARLRRRRRRVGRVALGAIAGGVAAIAAVVIIQGRRPLPEAPAGGSLAVAPAGRELRLADGSLAIPLDDGSEITVREDAPRRVAIELARGRGRFEVAPRPERPFSVSAGDVTITVIGTVFTVERIADRIGVTVTRGRVLVDWGVGSRQLGAGEDGWFPPLVVEAPAPAAASAPSSARPRDRSRAVARTEPSSAPAAVTPARATAESLLAAADAARLQGRAEEGAALLRKILQDHRADPRAPLAAFTLGRVLLMELGQPRQAAAAFAEARALAPDGPFAEDALAREVEAWARAGDDAKTRARARDYLRSYPSGRRAPAVRALGGGE
jgi:transmembrane sensor